MPELKPCPFCGNIPTLTDSVDDFMGPHIGVVCGCGIDGPPFPEYDYPNSDRKELAANHWNTRNFAGKQQAELVYTRLQAISFKHNNVHILELLHQFDNWLGERVLLRSLTNLSIYWHETPVQIIQDFMKFLQIRDEEAKELWKEVEKLHGRTEDK